MTSIKTFLNLGCILICSLFSFDVEAQEKTHVLQCDVTGWMDDLTGRQTGPTSKYSFTLEFISNGRVLNVFNDVTSELTVTVAETAYVFKRDTGGSFMTLNRLTGVLRSTERVEDRLLDEVGSCRPIKVIPPSCKPASLFASSAVIIAPPGGPDRNADKGMANGGQGRAGPRAGGGWRLRVVRVCYSNGRVIFGLGSQGYPRKNIDSGVSFRDRKIRRYEPSNPRYAN